MRDRTKFFPAILGLLGIALLAVLWTATGSSTVQADPPDGEGNTKEISKELRTAGADAKIGNELPPTARGDDNRSPRIGDHRLFLALDDTSGAFYFKEFQLRGADTAAEIWIASGPRSTDGVVGLNFPDGDCRNDGVRNVISNDQVTYLLEEFRTNIRPTDTAWFGEPNKRTGRNSEIQKLTSRQISGNAYYNKDGRDIVLVDNVRDDNFYDTDNSQTLPYIAGFFTTAMSFYFDRNIMTIDGFDWLHRTGEALLHEPSADPCTSAPARPYLYESVFAHEYQHLIHADYDADEVNWVNEGMSDLAEILTGYSDPSLHVDEKGHDSHTQAFLGWGAVLHPSWNPIARDGGPENSLTVWEDQGGLEVLADYGHAYYFMTYLLGQGYGQAFFTSWAHDAGNGIDGLNSALANDGSTDTFDSLFTEIAASVLADAYVDDGGTVSGDSSGDALQNALANATVRFSSDAYGTTGAPPWGSDYIPLGSGADLSTLEFDGDDQFEAPAGAQWVVDGDGYFTNPDGTGGNYESNQDLSITHEITVNSPGVLSFEHYYATEIDWDFGFVQISDDGGQTWESQACTGTTLQHDPGAISSIVANLPGYSGEAGTAGAPITSTCDLSAYSGSVLLAFRLMTDPSVELDGWHVRDVTLDGVEVGTPGDLSDWNNQKFYDPAALDFVLQLVGVDGTVDQYGHVSRIGNRPTDVVVVRPTLGAGATYSLTPADQAALAGSDNVVAIVSGVPETEDNGIYAPYTLVVNGTSRADGAGLP